MSSPAQNSSHEVEAEFLEGPRSRYQAEGFTFTIAPDQSVLPSFLGAYMPDAVARKAGLNIAIELRRQQTQATQASLRDTGRLFDGHPDWQFRVFFIGSGPLQSVTIPTASAADVRR